MKEKLKKFRVWIIVIALAGISLLSYSFVDNYFEVTKNLDIFASLFKELNIYYVDETNPGDLMKKGIDEMLESLDPYTNYYPESDIEDYKLFMTGQYGGIGALIRQHGDYVYISEPYEGFPAQKNDLRAGDKLLEINGASAKGKRTDEVSKMLKGSPSSSVKLLLEREGESKPIEKTITREEIKIKNVSYSGMVAPGVGYIKLTSFTDNAANEVKAALLDLKKNPDFKYLVFDLRGNGGGLLNEAVNIVNLFVDKGREVVSTRGKVKDWDKTLYADREPIDVTTPMAVLVNRGSASASEIVSGALQDLDRAVIIGQRSFGKGLVQQTKPLPYNAQLKVTIAKYYIPSGRCIQALDYSHKNADGSVDKVPDSLITAFKTVKNGRIVYDGAGIAPDIAVEPEHYANISASLVQKACIFDYATNYHLKHQSIPSPLQFKLSDEDYNDFMAFIKDREYDYTTKSEKLLEDLKKATEDDKKYDNLKAEFEALKGKVAHNKTEDLLKNKEEISALIEEEIASRYSYQRGRCEASLKTDKELTEAVKLLNDQKRYTDMLTVVLPATHPFHAEKVKSKEAEKKKSKSKN